MNSATSWRVSVPFRGSRSEMNDVELKSKLDATVSVPFRGSRSEIAAKAAANDVELKSSFRPLSGFTF